METPRQGQGHCLFCFFIPGPQWYSPPYGRIRNTGSRGRRTLSGCFFSADELAIINTFFKWNICSAQFLAALSIQFSSGLQV